MVKIKRNQQAGNFMEVLSSEDGHWAQSSDSTQNKASKNQPPKR
jgi:hypothetical protein